MTLMPASNGHLHGVVKSGFERVREAFQDNFSDRHTCYEVGATFSAYVSGNPVVHLWGGHANKAKTKEWTEHTVVNIFSSTKGVAAACLALLNSRGQLDYEAKVTDYWPQFGQKGKER